MRGLVKKVIETPRKPHYEVAAIWLILGLLFLLSAPVVGLFFLGLGLVSSSVKPWSTG